MRRDRLHASVVRDRGWFVAECQELAVVTQGRTLDDAAEALRAAVVLHLDGEDRSALGVGAEPRLVIQYELPIGN